MSQTLDQNEQIHLRQSIISQCIWSDSYSSLKQILQRTANQLPLLISFTSNEQNDDNHQTILFFDRNVSNKLLFSPLKQSEEHPEQFEVSPRHCIFALTDLFQGILEFVHDGRRSTRIFQTLEKLITFATNHQHPLIFMSRDCIQGRSYSDEHSIIKKYPQGSLFTAQSINPSLRPDRLECLDEDGYTVYLKIHKRGRFSLIATSNDQQENHPDWYLHSTQALNIEQLIQRLTSDNPSKNCIRLVRGGVPHHFHCQYLQFLRRHTHDILVGLTEEGLVVEWNLDSSASCRYATNLNDILERLSDSWEEKLLENYIDQARAHYRENFQINMQLISTRDWTAFLQYWKWTGEVKSIDQGQVNIPYQSRHRFHLVASIQDLSDDAKRLSKEFFKRINRDDGQVSDGKQSKKFTTKQHRFFSEMSKVLETTSHRRANRSSESHPRVSNLLAPDRSILFDKSAYDSNPHPPNNSTKKNARRTQ